MKNKALFDVTEVNNSAHKTLFLLHGTGGSKKDFLFLDELLQHSYDLVGIQGNLNEGGMSRYFKRVEDGVFDQESIQEESSKLHDFVHQWADEHALKNDQLYFLGYSNGANMILATMFNYPELFKHVVLLHARLPFFPKNKTNLSQAEIFASLGEGDQWVSEEQQQELLSVLEKSGADVTHRSYENGHELSKDEFRDVVGFLNKE